MSKRRKVQTTRVIQVSTRRPIDKQLVNVAQSLTTTQTSTVLITATFPCTIVGIRWQLNFLNNITTGATRSRWCIIRLKQGLTASTIATSDGSSLFDPEQECLVWGVSFTTDKDIGAGPQSVHMEGETKSMRKLMGGDRLVLIAINDTANGALLDGVVQFFCKS